MLKLKQSVQQAATLSLLVSLVFGSLAPAFSMPVFALEQVSNEKPAQQISTSQTDLSQADLLEKPLEAVPEPIIQPIDIGQINPVEISPEEIIPKEDLLPPDDANRDGEEPEPYIQKDEIKSLTDKLNINTDTNTGAFNYTYPIEIPAGRNNLQPDLALSYNNQDTNNQNLFGYGWSLNIPSIERLNKTGIDNLYTDNYFTSSLGGELAPISLSDDIHGTYGPRVENGDFLKYEYTTSSTWIITDKMGTVYTFGKIQADRQDNPSDNTKVYKWMLSEVRDTNDNFIRYQYYKDAGQIYPEKIFYTGHAEADGIFEVELVREERSDNLSSFQTGFAVTNNYRISQILVKIDAQWQKKYYLNYETGGNGNRSLLSGIQEAAPSPDQEVEAAMPEDEFDYQLQSTTTWTLNSNYIAPDALNYDTNFYVVDVNGDALADIVNLLDEAYYIRGVYINKGDGTGWVLDENFELPINLIDDISIDFGIRFVDVDGDNYADIIHSIIGSYGYERKSIYINKGDGTGWILDENYIVPVFFTSSLRTPQGVMLGDFNGDGLVDIIDWNSIWDPVDIYINKGDGTGWALDTNYNAPQSLMNDMSTHWGFYPVDVNNDGLIDLVNLLDYWQYRGVYINQGNGTGWELDGNYLLPTNVNDQYTADQGIRFADVNGDNYIDIIHSINNASGTDFNDVFINKSDETGWELSEDYDLPISFSISGINHGVQIADVNGDSLDDFVRWLGSGAYGVSEVYIAANNKPDLLANISVAGEKNINIDYQSSAQYTEQNSEVTMSTQRDGEVLMPEEEFEYPENFTEAWTDIENLDLPNIAAGYEGLFGDNGVRFGEVNGDGFIDIIHSEIKMTSHAGNIITKNVYINQGNNTWVIDSNYDIPVYFSRINNVGPYIFNEVYVEDGARLSDVNGDGLIDIIEARREADNTDTKHVYINKGDGTGWEEDLNYIIPFTFIERIETNGNSFDYDVRLADANGDGFDDVLIAYRHYNDPRWWGGDFVDTKHVYINKGDGTGWEEDLNYVVPIVFVYIGLNVYGSPGANSTLDTGVRLADVNGDSLIDIIEARTQRNPEQPRIFIQNVYLNKGDGTGWTGDNDYNFNYYFVELRDVLAGFLQETEDLRLMDINGDHLEDVIQSRYMYYNDQVTHYKTVSINHGDGIGWQNNPSYDIPFYFSIYDPYHEGMNDWFDNGCQIVDANGDSVSDVICSRPMYGNPHDVHNIYINNNHNKVLGAINNNQGTEIALNYQSSAQYTEPGEQVSMSSARDVEVLMPETEFGYQTNTNLGWSQDDNWQLPISFSGDGNEHQFGVVIADANGDSLPDIIQRGQIYNSLTERNNFSLNSGNDWGAGSHYVGVPVIINFREPYNHRVEDRGVRFVDVNGDNLVDVLQSFGVLRDVYINNGTSWNLDSSWTIPISFVASGVNAGVGIEIVDINGDGLIDIVQSNQNCRGQITNNVYINNGQAWILDQSWVVPEFISYCNGNINQVIFDMGVRFVDVNNDGLVDILRGYNQSRTVYINNGHSWTQDSSWILPEGFAYGRDGNVLNVITMDVNGDFLPDIVRSNNSEYNPNYSNANRIYLNNGHNWILQEDLQFPFTAHDASDEGIRISDVNGDNLVDVIKGFSNDRRALINNANTIFLNNINKDNGVNLFIDYQSSAQARDINDELANPNLPYIIQTVKQINVFDGTATTTIDYQYSGGEQYFDAERPRDKKFAGFAKVEKTIGDKTVKTYYHQGNETNDDFGESDDTYAKIGKVYRQEVYDIEHSQSVNIYSWQEQDFDSNRQFVFKHQESTSLLYGDRSFEDYLANRINDVHTVSLWHMDGEVGTSEKKYNENRNPNLDLVEGNNPTAVLGFDGISENGAYQFNGTNQYLSFIPYNAGTSDFTIDGWVKLSSINVSQPIFHQEQNGYTGRPNLNVWLNSANQVTCHAAEPGDEGLEDQYVVSNSALAIDTWTHIACSRENGLYNLYINGELDASNSYAHNNFVSGISSTAYFGRRYNSFYPNSQPYFHGAIDEWRISNTANIAVEPDNFDQLYADYLESLDNFDSIATQYSYDPTNGNILSENNLGQVELNTNTGEILDTLVGDEKTTTYEYATNEVKHILSAPKEKVISDTIDTKSQELYYDDLAFGQVNKVNLTKEDYLVDNVEINREFNDLGLVVAETDPENNVSEIVYDENNLYPSETTNALGQTNLTEYNLLNGQIDRSVAPNGAITENQYDAFGRLIKTWVSNNKSPNDLTLKQEISYDDYSFPRSKSVKDYFDVQRSYLIREYYDGLDRVIQTKKQLAEENSWSTQDTTYDVFGRVSRQSLPYISQSIDYSEPDLNQVAKTYTYDALDRVLTENTPVGTSTYEYNGFTTTIYDANNNRKDLVKDAHGNLVQVKEYNGQDIYTTNYEYNLTNKLTKIIDAQGNVRNFIYDELDNLVEQDEIHRSDVHNIQNLTYAYDKNGNVLSQNNFNGQVINYTYDDLNRVLTESVNGSLKIRYTYDQGLYNVGQLTRVEYLDNGNWQEYDYDILGRQSAYRVKIGRENYTLNQVNLLSGDVSYFEYPNGKFVSYVKNSIGQDLLLGVSGENQLFAENLRYNVNGQLIHLERGNGVVTDYTYDPAQAYRLTNILTSNSEAILQNISYTYDAVGNILQIEDIAINGLDKIATYQYDDLNRLLSTQVQYLQQPENNYTQTFSYDAIGNILSNSALGEYQYLAANPQQLSALGTRNFVYDNAGNLLNDSQKTLTWDWRSRLQKSQNFGTEDFTNYEYDHQNQRLAKITKTQRLDIEPYLEPIPIIAAAVSTPLPPPIDLPNEITLNEEHYVDQYFEKNVQTGDFKAHIFLNGQKIATINNNNAPYYIISDHLNSSSILVDDAGNIAEVSDYRPFGSEVYSNTIVDLNNDYNFTGKETDEESSLQYFGARYMDNNIGRFVSVDPAVLAFGNSKEFKDKYDRSLEFHLSNPQNLNAYSYVTNNPLRYTDPDGEIIPLLILGYVALEVGFSAWDAYDAGKAWFGEDSSNSDKAWATSGLVAGLVLPGGGYGRVAKVAAKQQNNVLRHVMFGSRKGGLHVLENAVSQGKKIENLQKVGKSGVMMGKIDGRFKTFFPSNWSTQDIKNSLSHLEKNQKMIERNGNVYIQSSKPYKGVYLEGTVNKGSITSFYPSQKLNK